MKRKMIMERAVMREFAGYIEETWDISYDIAETICKHFEENESLYFITDYVPLVATQVDFDTVSEIYSFLNLQRSLEANREKARNILKKADMLDDDTAYKIEMSISSTEIDDIAIAHRTSVRTRGSKAISAGLLPCADTIDEQKSEGDLDSLIAEYVGKDKNFDSDEKVRAGIVDILAERFGYDENLRIVAREFVEDNGFIEILFKKKLKKFDDFRDRQIMINEVTDEEILRLAEGEEKKEIKIKINAQLFQIQDLLNEYFIENNDAMGIEILHEALNDAWNRLLQPMVEESLKEMLITDAQNRVAREVRGDLQEKINDFVAAGKQSYMIVAVYETNELEVLTIDNSGYLLRASKDEIRDIDRPFVSPRIKQMLEQYRPAKIAVLNNKNGNHATQIVEHTVASVVSNPEVTTIAASTKVAGLLKSDFFKKSAETLDENTLKTYAYGVAIFVPLSLISEIGCQFFSIHPKQLLLGDEKMGNVVDELVTAALLKRGVELNRGNQDELLLHAGISKETLEMLREARQKKKIMSKHDLQTMETLADSDFNNAAGYIVFPASEAVLDKSTVHPVAFSLVESVSSEIGVTVEELCRDITLLERFQAEDESVNKFVKENLAVQLQVAKRYMSLSARPKRKLRLNELRVDAILDGRVTNITPFGVFVDINAMSDGLVHISELTNEFVESADQVVSVGDAVKVKVIEINKKQRRISLSMKQADNSGLRVSASRTQLNDLANFFGKM